MAIVGHFTAVTLVGSGSSSALEAVVDDIKSIKADIKSIKTDLETVKSNTSAIESTVTSNGIKLDAVQADVAVIKEQTVPPILE